MIERQQPPVGIVERCGPGHSEEAGPPGRTTPLGRSGVQVGPVRADAPCVTALPVLSRTVDRATGAVALVVLVVAACLPDALPPWQAWLVLPAVVLAGRKQLELPTASSQSLVVGLDSALLVLLGLALPPRQALLVWGVSLIVGEGTTRRSLDTRLFNAGVCVVSGALALAVLGLVPQDERTSLLGLVATVFAAATYFCVDYVWSAVSVAAGERLPLRETLQSHGLPLAFACFLGVDSLGFLAAVVLEARPWAVGLLAVPFVSLLLSTHSWSALRRVQQRSAGLSAAAVDLQQAVSLEEVEELVLRHAPLLVRAPGASWAAEGDPAGLPFVTDGSCRDLLLHARVTGEVFTADDLEALRMLLGVAEQAHERLRLLAVLRRSALEDPLTGLANRTVLHEQLAEAVQGAPGLAVLYCDLDGFKHLNDTRGHAVGDALLVAVADRLRTALRPQDLPVRMGGDEFAVLLRDLPDDPLPEAEGIAERLRAALARPYELGGGAVVVPASVGLCVRTGGEQPEDLLGGSDAAMYAAKAEGGRRVHVHGRVALLA